MKKINWDYGSIEKLGADFFGELGNIGTGAAVTALSNMIRSTVSVSVPHVMNLEDERLLEYLDSFGEREMGLLFPIRGEISGLLLYILKEDFLAKVLEHLGTEFEKLLESTDNVWIFKEVAGIMASAYFSSVSAYLERRIEIDEPAILSEMTGAAVMETRCMVPGDPKGNLCVECGFYLQAPENASHLILMLTEESAEEIFTSLGVVV
ncbi:MAG: chemotaxis protein CheC [Blautia sp.]|jgi:chemotaxis protein CheC